MISWRNPQDKMMYEDWRSVDPQYPVEPWSSENAIAVYEFFGLSTDEKPYDGDFGYPPNGAIFFEMDTSKIYLYDAKNGEWLEQKADQGGDPS